MQASGEGMGSTKWRTFLAYHGPTAGRWAPEPLSTGEPQDSIKTSLERALAPLCPVGTNVSARALHERFYYSIC
jgi:hypothetical protein